MRRTKNLVFDPSSGSGYPSRNDYSRIAMPFNGALAALGFRCGGVGLEQMRRSSLPPGRTIRFPAVMAKSLSASAATGWA